MRQRRAWLVLAAVFFCAAAAPSPSGSAPAGITLPGSSGQACVQVKVQGEAASAYNCLNQELQQQVEGAASAQPALPLSATSPSNQVGTFNRAGVAEQYGQNFGKSAIPYRPPAPVFSNALGPSR